MLTQEDIDNLYEESGGDADKAINDSIRNVLYDTTERNIEIMMVLFQIGPVKSYESILNSAKEIYAEYEKDNNS